LKLSRRGAVLVTVAIVVLAATGILLYYGILYHNSSQKIEISNMEIGYTKVSGFDADVINFTLTNRYSAPVQEVVVGTNQTVFQQVNSAVSALNPIPSGQSKFLQFYYYAQGPVSPGTLVRIDVVFGDQTIALYLTSVQG
jgi:hypothetical protein